MGKTRHTKKTAIVIGAGFGGLSAAALLAKDGYKVRVLEKNSLPGGRAAVLRAKGFVFDVSAFWYFFPDVIDRFFQVFGKKTSDYFSLTNLYSPNKIFWEDGSVVDVTDLLNNKKIFNTFEKNGGKKLQDYIKDGKDLYTIGFEKFVFQEFHTLRDLLNPELLREKRFTTNLFRSFYSYLNKFFESEYVKKSLTLPMLLVGGDIKSSVSLYSILLSKVQSGGLLYPEGGVTSIIDAMMKVCRENKVTFSFHQEVIRIGERKEGGLFVKTKQKKYEADIVIANADYHHVESTLLFPKDRTYDDSFWEKKTIAPSVYMVLLGLSDKITNLSSSNFIICNNSKHPSTVFEDQSSKENIYYIFCPSKIDKKAAPLGSETLTILTPVEPGLIDTDKQRKLFLHTVIEDIENAIGEKIEEKIVYQKIISNKDFINDFNSYKGTAFGLLHTAFQTGPFRLPHKSKKVKNLYFTGNYTQPGMGISMAILSSMQVVDDIKKNEQ